MQSSFDGNDNKLLIELGKANSKYNLHRNMQSSPTMATVTTQATAITINTKRGSSTQEENDSIKIRRARVFLWIGRGQPGLFFIFDSIMIKICFALIGRGPPRPLFISILMPED